MAANALKGVSGAALVAYALTYQGVKYVWGGADPSGFDCSGLAQWVYKRRAGIDLPRVTYQQASMGRDVLGGPYLPGDLLFFFGGEHEGISLGGSRFIHAPHTGDVVKISTLGSAYQPSAARRILTDTQAGEGKVSSVPTTLKDTGSQAASWGDWAAAFLAKLGVPATGNNARVVIGWLKAENPNDSDTWNPLATTLKTKSALKGGGVQAYSSEAAGLDATVQTLQSGQYGVIRRALAANAPTQETWDAIRSSPWDAGHYASLPAPPSVTAGDLVHPVVGSKKGSGGLLGDVAGAAGDVWGLPGAAKDAVTGIPSGVEGAIESAAGTVVSGVEGVAIRISYALTGLVMAAFALYLLSKAVGNPAATAGSGLPGKAGAAAGEAGGAAELAAVA